MPPKVKTGDAFVICAVSICAVKNSIAFIVTLNLPILCDSMMTKRPKSWAFLLQLREEGMFIALAFVVTPHWLRGL